MKTYKVIVKEILYHEFYVDAENEDQVYDKYEAMALRGDLDFSRGEVDMQDIVKVKEV